MVNLIKLIINDIKGYNYYLKDKNDRMYESNIEFYDLETLPQKNDVIYMDKMLLHKINDKMVSFGPLDGKYGKNITSENDEDIIILETENQSKKKYLKRYYG